MFAFLPLTQARRGNIVVDTFTGWLPPRIQRAIDAFWDLVYAAFMGLVAWRLERRAATPSQAASARWCSDCRCGRVFACGALLALLLAVTAIVTATDARAAGAPMSGSWIAAILGFVAMLVLIALRMPVGLVDARRGLDRLRLLSGWGASSRLHEDQPLLPVRQLHALGHPAVHPDGRVRRALGLSTALFRAAAPLHRPSARRAWRWR